jgi:hypothetical protein
VFLRELRVLVVQECQLVLDLVSQIFTKLGTLLIEVNVKKS